MEIIFTNIGIGMEIYRSQCGGAARLRFGHAQRRGRCCPLESGLMILFGVGFLAAERLADANCAQQRQPDCQDGEAR